MTNTTPTKGAMPIRVQRKRAKGWRMPANTVYVGRGTKWGNPYKVISDIRPYRHSDQITIKIGGAVTDTRAEAVEKYKTCLDGHWMPSPEDAVKELKGKNLACWCPIGEPCHADYLLEIANGR